MALPATAIPIKSVRANERLPRRDRAGTPYIDCPSMTDADIADMRKYSLTEPVATGPCPVARRKSLIQGWRCERGSPPESLCLIPAKCAAHLLRSNHIDVRWQATRASTARTFAQVRCNDAPTMA